MELFNKQYKFTGRHAQEVDALTSPFSDKKMKFFPRNVDVYINAPLIGFLYGRKAEKDYTKNPNTGEVFDQNVMGDRVIYSQTELLYNYRLIMLLDKEYEADEDKRVDKAFRNMGEVPEDMELFDSYVRGGVDVLYEKLIKDEPNPDNYINRLYDFIADYEERFNSELNKEDILKLCYKE